MNQLIQLADNIHSFNLIGTSKLPTLKLALLQTNIYTPIVHACLQQLQCQPATINAQDASIRGYGLYRSIKVKGMEVYLVNSLEDEENIGDQQFIKRKKLIQRLKASKEVIFLNFGLEAETKTRLHDRSELMTLRRVDSTISKDIQWRGSLTALYQQLAKKWESISRFEVMTCLQNLRLIVKNQCSELPRQQQWLFMANGKVDTLSYAFKLINVSKEYLVCSLEGYFSKNAHRFEKIQSVHWQIMDILEDLWHEEGEKLNREIDRMPLSYIGDSLRMSDYHSIGGFLPEDCFLRVFKPLLSEFSEAVITCLGAIKYKVIKTLQTVYDYYFDKTTVKEAFMEAVTRQIQQICDAFLLQVENSLQSQISYVYAPAETFWEMRNIKSNLYSPEQQANIEVKYIGKVYVKRVYESIRESIPRYLGHGLLRKVSKYISANALNCLLEVMKDVPFEVRLSPNEIQEIVEKERRKMECERLIKYFSLKVSSTYLIKNLLEKQDYRWKQMYGSRDELSDTMIQLPKQQRQDRKGIIGWMKNLFNSKEPKAKRSQSNEKLKIQPAQTEKRQQQKADIKINDTIISQKIWILAINTNRKIQDKRLQAASADGFPYRLRPAIWYWMAKRAMHDQKQLKLIDIMTNGIVDPEVARQIQKDLGRTPPNQLFRKKMRDSLRRVLEAYSLTDPEIQYTQGMNFIAAIILCTLVHWGIRDDYLAQSCQKPNLPEIEQRAFTIFRFLMLKQGLRKMMFIEREHIAELCYRVDAQIRELNPKVAGMIDQCGFTCQLIFSPILISGLATWSKNIAVGRRVLDLVLGRGFGILYKVVAGVTAMSQRQLSKLKHEMVYEFLRTKAMDEFYDQLGEKGLSQLFLQL